MREPREKGLGRREDRQVIFWLTIVQCELNLIQWFCLNWGKRRALCVRQRRLRDRTWNKTPGNRRRVKQPKRYISWVEISQG